MDDAFPGGPLRTRPLHFVWIADCSGSMAHDGKIQALNTVIRDVLPAMQTVADDNHNAEVLVRAIRFSTGAQWHVAQPTPLANFTWTDLPAAGVTDLGKALSLVAGQLQIPPMEDRALPPVLVLISDGQPTDDYKSALNHLLGLPWGKRAVRIAIAIGDDADLDVLQQFIGHTELAPLVAKTAEQLATFIHWASTAVLSAVSSGRSDHSGPTDMHVALPEPPQVVDDPDNADDVW